MGPGTCFKMIKEKGSIEKVLDYCKNAGGYRKKPFIIPDPFPYKEARELFINPDVNRNANELNALLNWTAPLPELKDWMINEKGFTEPRTSNGIDKLNKFLKKK
jgi:flap endonuclease-1